MIWEQGREERLAKGLRIGGSGVRRLADARDPSIRCRAATSPPSERGGERRRWSAGAGRDPESTKIRLGWGGMEEPLAAGTASSWLSGGQLTSAGRGFEPALAPPAVPEPADGTHTGPHSQRVGWLAAFSPATAPAAASQLGKHNTAFGTMARAQATRLVSSSPAATRGGSGLTSPPFEHACPMLASFGVLFGGDHKCFSAVAGGGSGSKAQYRYRRRSTQQLCRTGATAESSQACRCTAQPGCLRPCWWSASVPSTPVLLFDRAEVDGRHAARCGAFAACCRRHGKRKAAPQNAARDWHAEDCR